MSTRHENPEQRPLLDGSLNDDGLSLSSKLLPASPEPDNYRALARIVGCCFSALATGWHDGCIGALIPYLQVYYGGVSDERVSFVFIGSFTGYTIASLSNVSLSSVSFIDVYLMSLQPRNR